MDLCHLAAAIIKDGEKEITVVNALKPDVMVMIMEDCGESFTIADFEKKNKIRLLRKANAIIIRQVIEKCYCQCFYKKK